MHNRNIRHRLCLNNQNNRTPSEYPQHCSAWISPATGLCLIIHPQQDFVLIFTTGSDRILATSGLFINIRAQQDSDWKSCIVLCLNIHIKKTVSEYMWTNRLVWISVHSRTLFEFPSTTGLFYHLNSPFNFNRFHTCVVGRWAPREGGGVGGEKDGAPGQGVGHQLLLTRLAVPPETTYM